MCGYPLDWFLSTNTYLRNDDVIKEIETNDVPSTIINDAIAQTQTIPISSKITYFVKFFQMLGSKIIVLFCLSPQKFRFRSQDSGVGCLLQEFFIFLKFF